MNDLMRALVVEDDRYGQEVVTRMLNFVHLHADVAASAELALDMLDHFEYMLIVIDLALPGMDGWELLRTIRTRPKLAMMPCVAITAFHDMSVARDALSAGFTAYIPKPLQASFVPQIQKIVTTH